MSKNCISCHHEIPDDARFCNNCGAQQPASQQGADQPQGAYRRPDQEQPSGQNGAYQGQNASQGGAYQGQPSGQGTYQGKGSAPHANEVFTVEDVERNKVISALGYIIFFIPLIAAPESPFARFHANQSLLLLILSVAGNIILGVIPFINVVLAPLFSLLCFILFIMGLVNTLNGKARELPVIGQYRIIH